MNNVMVLSLSMLQTKDGRTVPGRQDSVTGGGGGAEINFLGAREVYLCEFERARGHEKFILLWIKSTR